MRTGFLILLCVASTALAENVPEDFRPQKWPSPNGKLVMQHRLADDLLSGVKHQPLGLTAYTLCDGEGTVLWSGVSWVDNSAHSFDCIWTDSSLAGLILERPSRADVEAILVRANQPATASVLKVQEVIDQELLKTQDVDDRHLQKAWFGQWRFSHGKFEGVIIVARGQYHRLHVTLDPSQDSPKLVLSNAKVFQEWDDDAEKLP